MTRDVPITADNAPTLVDCLRVARRRLLSSAMFQAVALIWFGWVILVQGSDDVGIRLLAPGFVYVAVQYVRDCHTLVAIHEALADIARWFPEI